MEYSDTDVELEDRAEARMHAEELAEFWGCSVKYYSSDTEDMKYVYAELETETGED